MRGTKAKKSYTSRYLPSVGSTKTKASGQMSSFNKKATDLRSWGEVKNAPQKRPNIKIQKEQAGPLAERCCEVMGAGIHGEAKTSRACKLDELEASK